MRIELQVFGGIAALNVAGGGLRTPPLVVDTDGLPEADLQELRQMIEAAAQAPTPPRARPDATSHRIVVTDGDRVTAIVGRDSAMPPEVGTLIAWIRRYAGRVRGRTSAQEV